MKQEMLTMSQKELKRLKIMEKIKDKRLTQVDAGKALGLSSRQVGTLYRGYLKEGPKALLSKKRGKRSNRRICKLVKEEALNIIRADYYDYGPTLAAEKLDENNHITVSKETIRQWMIEAGLRCEKHKKPIVLHQLRQRRNCEGELIQMDGSDHEWFENRAPRCTLLVAVDDATSKIKHLKFVGAETTFDYFSFLKEYVLSHGKPLNFYTDKHNVFNVNIKEAKSGTGYTQFGRALMQLDINLILAHSPEAKGRVERANGTLQDRLVKELRYCNISDIETANEFLKSFVLEYNLKFAKIPKNNFNAHMPLTVEEKANLDFICCKQTKRKISDNLMLRHNNVIYNIKEPGKTLTLRRTGALVCEEESGKITIYHHNKQLRFEVYNESMHQNQILSKKEIQQFLPVPTGGKERSKLFSYVIKIAKQFLP